MKPLFILVYLVILVSAADTFLVSLCFEIDSWAAVVAIPAAILLGNSCYAAIVYWCVRIVIDEAKEPPVTK